VRKEIYATACVAGSVVFLLAQMYMPGAAVILSMITTFGIRAAAIQWRLQLPGFAWKSEPSCDLHRRRDDI